MHGFVAHRLTDILNALLFTGLGGYFVWLGLGAAWRVRRAQATWQVVSGQVLEGGLNRYGSSGGHAAPLMYSAQMQYTYRVSGAEYTGQRVTLHDIETSWSGPQRALLERYPVGQPVTVHYDPAQPQHSALELRQGRYAWCFPALGLLFFLIGLSLVRGLVAAALR